MLYFAYGSNLSTARMKERCPDYQFQFIAYLENHVLCFPQHNKDEHLVAGFKYADGKRLWGVVYSVTETDCIRRKGLFQSEGYNADRDEKINSYRKINVQLKRPDTSESVTCVTFIQNKTQTQPPGGKPQSKQYLNFIISGYEEHGLDQLDKITYDNLKSEIITAKD